jgi:hypothetical protein
MNTISKEQTKMLSELKSMWINDKLIDSYPFAVSYSDVDSFQDDVTINMCMLLVEYFNYKVFGMELPYKENDVWFIVVIQDCDEQISLSFIESNIDNLYNQTLQQLIEVEDYVSCDRLKSHYDLYTKFVNNK